MEQDKQTAPDGSTIFRWYVFAIDGTRLATWAPTKEAAALKGEHRFGHRPRVEPAPPLLNAAQMGAIGGRSTSSQKIQAAQVNGRLGGRPRKRL